MKAANGREFDSDKACKFYEFLNNMQGFPQFAGKTIERAWAEGNRLHFTFTDDGSASLRWDFIDEKYETT